MNGQDQKKEYRDTEFKEKGQKVPWGWPEGMPERMAKCCEGMGGDGARNMTGKMVRCCGPMIRVGRWIPLIPIVLGGAAFLLGYYLNPATVRMLWLVFSGAVILMAILGLILANAMCRAKAWR